jgi:GH15 family glucan-1,4-alpha-glucosidase
MEMFLPIQDYGLIGNMRTAALVGKNGSIDWFCPQRFDSPSVFAALLDEAHGGHFVIAPEHAEVTFKQFYWPETNVLVTRFLGDEGVLQIVDYMPLGVPEDTMRERWLVRRVQMVRGSLPLRVVCHPAFDYARDPHKTQISPHGAIFSTPERALGLASPVALHEEDGAAVVRFTPREGDTLIFSLQLLPPEADAALPPLEEADENTLFEATVKTWRTWLAQCTYTGRWREMVHRSALAMKLLTYEPTGAIVAAPTCSLPEKIGGARNWDYRYTWLRDAAFAVYGFVRIGFTNEARAFVHWLEQRIQEAGDDGTLQIMYTIDGGHTIPEEHLDHLSGYRGSSPVRIGNAAYQQLQLDIYGELMDAIYLYNKYTEPVSYQLWTQIRVMLDWVCEHWQDQDRGIWEIRGANQPFVYSKVMLWVALDRGIRLAEKRSLPAPRERWRDARDRIYEEIMVRGWNEDLGAFTQTYDGDSLDAANLIMPLVFFLSPHDPRMARTIDAINRPPDAGGLVSEGLVLRYNTDHVIDNLTGDEGTFNLCTFWLVEALTRAGRLDEAQFIFEQMLSQANHVGLFSEETGFRGQALGNYPQALTHFSLISAAFNLDRALS